MPKPASLPEWADGAAWVAPPTGPIVEPLLAQKQHGFDPGNTVPAQWLNWLFNLLYQWIVWLNAFETTAHTWTAQQTFNVAGANCIDATATGGFPAIIGTGSGANAGVEGHGAAIAGGLGLFGQTAGNNVGAVAGVMGLGSNTAGAGRFSYGGIFSGGSGGSGGAGVWAYAAAASAMPGVKGDGDGAGAGGYFTGGATGVGAFGLGGGAGVFGVQGQGGAAGGPGVYGLGVAGGGFDYAGVVGQGGGITGYGGSFRGGAGGVLGAAIGLFAVGGSATGNNGAMGADVQGSGVQPAARFRRSDGANYLAAILSQGAVDFDGAAPAAAGVASKNLLGRDDFVKARLLVKFNGTAAPVVLASKNITSAVQSIAGGTDGQLTVTFAQPFLAVPGVAGGYGFHHQDVAGGITATARVVSSAVGNQVLKFYDYANALLLSAAMNNEVVHLIWFGGE
jgi:hypothetical protein